MILVTVSQKTDIEEMSKFLDNVYNMVLQEASGRNCITEDMELGSDIF